MVNIWFSPNILACLTYRMLKFVLNVAEIYDNVKTIPFSMSIVVNMIFGGPSPPGRFLLTPDPVFRRFYAYNSVIWERKAFIFGM